jgi:glucosamine-6-phosphate deaminase
MKIIVVDNYSEVGKVSAKEVEKLINDKQNCILGLATGSTPVSMYQELIEMYNKGEIDFSKVTTFNLDEYKGLKGDHVQSYRYFMDTNLFNHINIDTNNTHVPNGTAHDIEKECENYDRDIEGKGGIDLQVLGIGTNGHIGFNEPSDFLNIGTHLTNLKKETIESNSRFFQSIEEVPTQAITMGLGSIMKAKKIMLLASGKNKAEIIAKLAEGQISTEVPASILQVHNDVLIIVDKDAASLLKEEIINKIN